MNFANERKLCFSNVSSFSIHPFIEDDEGLTYKIDADSLLKLINSHVESEITQVEIVLPSDNYSR